MMLKTKPFIILGAGMMLIGVIVPLLMVAQIIKATFFLSFVSYLCSAIGMFIGTMAVMSWVKEKRDGRK